MRDVKSQEKIIPKNVGLVHFSMISSHNFNFVFSIKYEGYFLTVCYFINLNTLLNNYFNGKALLSTNCISGTCLEVGDTH